MTAEGGAPRVTVAVPCFGHAQHLAECLGSLLAQTFGAWEAIVVDDASPDAAEVPRALARLQDGRIRHLRHDENRGPAAARNTALRAGEGELVLVLDATDALEPECLATLVEALESTGAPGAPGAPEQRADCAYPDVRLFGRRDDTLVFAGPRDGGPVRRFEDALPGPGCLMRRSFLEAVGGFDEHEALREGGVDLEFWMRAFARSCRARRVAAPLYRRRVSHRTASVARRIGDAALVDHLLEKHAALFEGEDGRRAARELRRRGYSRAAVAARARGHRGRAARLALEALKLDPSRTGLRLLGTALLSPGALRDLRDGELRARIPLAGTPLRTDRRYAPFFVIGVGRSGNTLYRRVLTSHSRLHIPPETFVLGECIKKFRRYRRKLSWADLVSFVLSRFELHPESHTFGVRLAPLAQRLVNVPAGERSLACILDGFFRYHAEVAGGAPPAPDLRWGDKTPLSSLGDGLARGNLPRKAPGRGVPETLERILTVFPDAQFLHIVRDGCDVASSFLRGGFVDDVEEAGLRWLHTQRQTRHFVERHPERSHSIRYEDLTGNPEATIRSTCAFLGVEFEPGMLSSEGTARTLGDVPEWSWHENVTRPIDAKNAGKGRRQLTRSERERLQASIGAELERLGYPPATAVGDPDPA